jgi:hypothetical protein
MSCCAGKFNFVHPQGVTWQMSVVERVRSTQEPVDLTDALARVVVSAGTPSGPVVLELDSADLGGVTVDGPAGEIAWSTPMDLPAGSYYYIVTYSLNEGAGPIESPLRGCITLEATPGYITPNV